MADNARLTARLEDGTTATFAALAFQVAPPAQLENRWPEIELRLDGAAAPVEPHLETTLQGDEPVSVTFREHVRALADEGPGRVTAGLQPDRTEAGDMQIAGVAGFYGLDRPFGRTFGPDDYPTLAG